MTSERPPGNSYENVGGSLAMILYTDIWMESTEPTQFTYICTEQSAKTDPIHNYTNHRENFT